MLASQRPPCCSGVRCKTVVTFRSSLDTKPAAKFRSRSTIDASGSPSEASTTAIRSGHALAFVMWFEVADSKSLDERR